MAKKKYNTVVIGAGPAGYVAAIRCAQLGMHVAVIDERCNDGNPTLGGTCLNIGCIPSKALLESSHHYSQLANFETHGIRIEKPSLDIERMMQRKESIVKKLNQGISRLFKHHRIDCHPGKGQLQDSHTINVIPHSDTAYTIQAEHIILATGSRPIELSVAPFDGLLVIDSEAALSLSKAPKKLGIVGAGAIGLELGAVWQRLGSQTTFFEMAEAFLPMLDARMSRQAQTLILPKNETTLHLNTQVSQVKKNKASVNVTYEKNGEILDERFDCLLVAAGRRPNTDSLFADSTLVNVLDSGEIDVNEFCQTHLPNVYAIGDIVRGPKLAHKGSKEGIMVAERIAGKHSQIDYDCIPSIIYTHPEIATVGLNEAQLKEKNIPYQAGQSAFTANGRALAADEATGTVKLFSHQESNQILGAQIIGPNASELIQQIVNIMSFSGTNEDIAAIIHGHPTLSEAIAEAAENSLGIAIHSAK